MINVNSIGNGANMNQYKITLSFVDACLPDYFGGHHLPVLSVPVDGCTFRKDIYDDLVNELNSGVIDSQLDTDYPGIDYCQIRAAIKDCLFFNDNALEDDTIFPDLPVWQENDNSDSVYAYFVLDIEKES